jgi:predicted nucleotidyltransferase
MTDDQAALIEQLAEALAADARIRSVWLSGSLGKGCGDAWSDVDLTVEVDESDRRACLADYAADHPDLPQLVLAREVYGRVLTAVTADWARFDLAFLTPVELARVDGGGLKLLVGDPSVRPSPYPADEPGAPARLTALVEEFLRVLGLSPVAVGRQEWLVAHQGWDLLRGMLIDLMLEENRVSPGARGVKRLNPFLTPEQRALLEGLAPPRPGRDPLIAANGELAGLFLPRARALAQARGVAWPEAFEQATRRHLEQTVGLRI